MKTKQKFIKIFFEVFRMLYDFELKLQYDKFDCFVFKPSDESKMQKVQIIEMLHKEQSHLAFLRKQEPTEQIKKYIDISHACLHHLETKINERNGWILI